MVLLYGVFCVRRCVRVGVMWRCRSVGTVRSLWSGWPRATKIWRKQQIWGAEGGGEGKEIGRAGRQRKYEEGEKTAQADRKEGMEGKKKAHRKQLGEGIMRGSPIEGPEPPSTGFTFLLFFSFLFFFFYFYFFFLPHFKFPTSEKYLLFSTFFKLL